MSLGKDTKTPNRAPNVVSADFTVTLRPEPKGLGRCAIAGMDSYFTWVRPPPQILHLRVQKDIFMRVAAIRQWFRHTVFPMRLTCRGHSFRLAES